MLACYIARSELSLSSVLIVVTNAEHITLDGKSLDCSNTQTAAHTQEHHRTLSESQNNRSRALCAFHYHALETRGDAVQVQRVRPSAGLERYNGSWCGDLSHHWS